MVKTIHIQKAITNTHQWLQVQRLLVWLVWLFRMIAIPLGLLWLATRILGLIASRQVNLLACTSNDCLGFISSAWLDHQLVCLTHSLSWGLEIMFYVLPAVNLGLLSTKYGYLDSSLHDRLAISRLCTFHSKGLSEKEISNKHIFKNAMVPLVSGIPGAVIGVIAVQHWQKRSSLPRYG